MCLGLDRHSAFPEQSPDPPSSGDCRNHSPALGKVPPRLFLSDEVRSARPSGFFRRPVCYPGLPATRGWVVRLSPARAGHPRAAFSRCASAAGTAVGKAARPQARRISRAGARSALQCALVSCGPARRRATMHAPVDPWRAEPGRTVLRLQAKLGLEYAQRRERALVLDSWPSSPSSRRC